ncbi:unnamed protein product [Effrenium voratum]|nr:unnamed protein product [Effrenium voratum]
MVRTWHSARPQVKRGRGPTRVPNGSSASSSKGSKSDAEVEDIMQELGASCPELSLVVAEFQEELTHTDGFATDAAWWRHVECRFALRCLVLRLEENLESTALRFEVPGEPKWQKMKIMSQLLEAFEEKNWPNGLRIFLYVLGLFYCFLGVAVVSDIFMNAIERITSQKKRVRMKSGKIVTQTVWNDTMANLTLMALGSSAPEILLSIIEIMSNEMYIGDLGSGTVVGSAAFNLLIISAVCVCSIPDGEVRYIKETGVYAITASFSIFAYVWLLFILMVFSPDICEVWEGVVTFLLFPLLPLSEAVFPV